MSNGERRTHIWVSGNPIHPFLASLPSTCFVGALITDVAYWRTTNMQWANFSAWLLAVGLFVCVFAVIVGLIDFFSDHRIRALGVAWAYALGNAVVIVLEIFNSFIHSRDAYTSVVPTGLILSAVSVLILLLTGWMGWELVFYRRVIVAEDKP